MLIDLPAFEAHVQKTITKESSIAEATGCLEDASAAVLTFCERLDDPWDELTVPAGVVLVLKRVAARLFENPGQRTSYTGPDGLNYAGGPVRLLTDDEKEMLGGFVGSSKMVGTIRMGQAPWMTPQ